MDPLTIAGAVIGIVASAGKMIPTIQHLVFTMKDAPKLARHILTELMEITAAVESLQAYIFQSNGSPNSHHIQLQQLVATLTGCVMTYSELEPILDSLKGSQVAQGAWNRAKWLYHEPNLERIVERLQRHKASLSLMLNILQCHIMTETQQYIKQLQTVISQLVCKDHDLLEKLRNTEETYERNVDAALITTPHQFQQDDESDTRTIRQTEPETRQEEINTLLQMRDFELDLFRSFPYTRPRLMSSAFSATSTMRGTDIAPRSIFSTLSIDHISILSQFAIPIYARDLSNSQCYSFHGTPRDQLSLSASPNHHLEEEVVIISDADTAQRYGDAHNPFANEPQLRSIIETRASRVWARFIAWRYGDYEYVNYNPFAKRSRVYVRKESEEDDIYMETSPNRCTASPHVGDGDGR